MKSLTLWNKFNLNLYGDLRVLGGGRYYGSSPPTSFVIVDDSREVVSPTTATKGKLPLKVKKNPVQQANSETNNKFDVSVLKFVQKNPSNKYDNIQEYSKKLVVPDAEADDMSHDIVRKYSNVD